MAGAWRVAGDEAAADPPGGGPPGPFAGAPAVLAGVGEGFAAPGAGGLRNPPAGLPLSAAASAASLTGSGLSIRRGRSAIDQAISSNSISNTSFEWGGIIFPAPRAP
jgi:hypothetical protein